MTPEAIERWWRDVYTPLRTEVFAQWRPASKPFGLKPTKGRVAKLRKLVDDHCPGDAAYQLGGLTHVVRAAAARVAKSKGEIVDYRGRPYDTMGNIDPAYWATDKHFPSLLGDDADAPTRKRAALPEVSSDNPFAGMQAHEIERMM